MKYNTLKRKYAPVEETKLDFSAEEVSEKDSLRLVLIDISHQTEQKDSSPLPVLLMRRGDPKHSLKRTNYILIHRVE